MSLSPGAPPAVLVTVPKSKVMVLPVTLTTPGLPTVRPEAARRSPMASTTDSSSRRPAVSPSPRSKVKTTDSDDSPSGTRTVTVYVTVSSSARSEPVVSPRDVDVCVSVTVGMATDTDTVCVGTTMVWPSAGSGVVV